MAYGRAVPDYSAGGVHYLLALISLCLSTNVFLVRAEVLVINKETNVIITKMPADSADFGPMAPSEGLTGHVAYADPHKACGGHINPPPAEISGTWIALIARGGCSFEEKVIAAQKAGYSAVIVHNYQGDNSLMTMSADSAYGNQAIIPSVFVGYSSGRDLAGVYNFKHKKVLIQIEGPPQYNIMHSLTVPLAIISAAIVLFACTYAIGHVWHCCRNKRATRQSRDAVERIPTQRFRNGDHYDVCAICLEDYEEGNKLRVLPCQHTYHLQCIDPWLIEKRKRCPQCFRRALPRGFLDSESSTEEEVNENTPLINPSQSSIQVYQPRNRPMYLNTIGLLPGRSARTPLFRLTSETAPPQMSRFASHASAMPQQQQGDQPVERSSAEDALCVWEIEDDAIRPQVLLEQGRDSSRRSVSVAIHDEPCPVWPPLQQLQQQQQDSWQQASQEELEGAVGGVGISDVENFQYFTVQQPDQQPVQPTSNTTNPPGIARSSSGVSIASHSRGFPLLPRGSSDSALAPSPSHEDD